MSNEAKYEKLHVEKSRRQKIKYVKWVKYIAKSEKSSVKCVWLCRMDVENEKYNIMSQMYSWMLNCTM